MPLYILTPRNDLALEGDDEYRFSTGLFTLAEELEYQRRNPWHQWWERAHGFVVRAPDEPTARRLANEQGGDEKRLPDSEQICDVWLMPQFTECRILTDDGSTDVILRHFRHG